MARKPPQDRNHADAPPEAWGPLLRLSRFAIRPLDRFFQIEAASGILLMAAAAAALIWANSSWSESYFATWHTPIGIRIGSFTFERSLEWFVNDGLMVIFFFVVGLEIRREVYQGSLSEWRRAALPAAAAMGGMIVPAALYLAIAGGPSTRQGWGVPMATDIAFAVGILTLLRKRIPDELRILLLAIAVIDDLGAILVIAAFYSSGVALNGLFAAAAALGLIYLMQRFGIRSRAAYVVPGILAWAGIYAAGVHPTIAGVLVGFITPVKTWLGPTGFARSVQRDLDRLPQAEAEQLSSHDVSGILRQVNAARREALSPTDSLIEDLHPWVAFGIMPIFALANAGVKIELASLQGASLTVATGVAVGLFLGKPVGVLLASWIALKTKLGSLPAGITMRHVTVLGVIAGVGFTMSLFIAPLAFEDAGMIAAAKIGILAASACGGAVGLILGCVLLKPLRSA